MSVLAFDDVHIELVPTAPCVEGVRSSSGASDHSSIHVFTSYQSKYKGIQCKLVPTKPTWMGKPSSSPGNFVSPDEAGQRPQRFASNERT